jgi:transcriptional regulator with XRE-family HTH domain
MAELEFGQRLRQALASARATTGKSARTLAKATDISVDTIYALERGDVLSPGFHTVYLLATELGLNLDALASEAAQGAPAHASPRRATRRKPSKKTGRGR